MKEPKTLSFQIENEMKKKLKNLAKKDRRSISEFCRIILEKEIEKKEKENENKQLKLFEIDELEI